MGKKNNQKKKAGGGATSSGTTPSPSKQTASGNSGSAAVWNPHLTIPHHEGHLTALLLKLLK